MKKTLNKKTNINPRLLFQIAIAVITCFISVLIIQWGHGLFKAEFREGDIALRDIFAPYDFSIKGEVDTKATEALRKKAADSVLPIYIFDVEAENKVLKKIESFVNELQLFKDGAGITTEEKSLKLGGIAASYNVSENLVTGILELKDPDVFFKAAKDTIIQFMSTGIISISDYVSLKEAKVEIVKIINKIENTESERYIDDFFTLDNLRKKIELQAAGIIKDKKEKSIFIDFVNAISTVNLKYEKEQTEIRRQLAAQGIQPVYSIIEVKKNETILNKGERIGKMDIEKLKGIEQKESYGAKIGGLFGIAIIVGLFIIFITLYIKFYELGLIEGTKELVLVALICILLLFVSKIIILSPWPSSLIPVAVASMLIAILVNSRLAIVATCFLSILVGMIAGDRIDIVGISLVGGIVGIFAMRGVRRRSQVIAAGLAVGFANMSYLIGTGLMQALNFNVYITESLLGLGNGLMSAVIVTGLLPVFENTFKITTDISLLELADLNHPLLKQMVMEAPGTYHHSLVVGNLAEAACEAIGANSLLARVGSYFHDIGKIEKASYFSENQSAENSAHDKLSPTMSSLIITNHVKNGIEVAEKYKLNRTIIDIIMQHHGTGLVFYFFKRALEKIGEEEIGEQSFRYPGPKPQTKEAACVLLADSVEAASRSLEDPTPSRIKGLVRKIINNKFIDGQLDECDLTLRDLERISGVFIHIITGIFHTRVEYPEGPEKKK